MEDYMKSISIDVLCLRKKQTKRNNNLTPEQVFNKNARRLKNKIERGDLDIKNSEGDKRLYYWGIKHGVIDKNKNFL